MSTKQFIPAEEHLAKLGVTVQQAQDFIANNISRPEIIFEASNQFSITNNMLSEITNISINDILNYFEAGGVDSNKLDRTSILINSDPGSLETLVDFNNNSGILSNAALSEAVRPLLFNEAIYNPTFEPVKPFQSVDDIYDAEELGVGHLFDTPATNESIESIFYGTLINLFETVDQSELTEFNAFPNNGDPEDFQVLVLEILNESPSSSIWTEEQLAGLVANEAADIINKFWEPGGVLVGVLDHSLLGLATA